MTPTQIAVVFSSRRQALEYSSYGGRGLSIFVPTAKRPDLRSEVVLDITFGDGAGHFLLCGLVSFHRSTWRGPTQPPGVVVAFETPEQKKKASELIAFCAGRPLSDGSASSHRTQLASRCIVRDGHATFLGRVRDVSATGAFVAALLPRNIKEGAEIELQVKPLFGNFGGKRLHARVIWMGHKYGVFGFGARFVGKADEIKRGVAALT